MEVLLLASPGEHQRDQASISVEDSTCRVRAGIEGGPHRHELDRPGGFPVDDYEEPGTVGLMRRLPEGGAVAWWGLVALSLILLVGHICVLPTHLHAAVPAHADAEHSHEAEEVHAASCEAVRSSGAAFPVPLAPVVHVTVATFVDHSKSRVSGSALSPSLKSPRLFLLHAALLI